MIHSRVGTGGLASTWPSVLEEYAAVWHSSQSLHPELIPGRTFPPGFSLALCCSPGLEIPWARAEGIGTLDKGRTWQHDRELRDGEGGRDFMVIHGNTKRTSLVWKEEKVKMPLAAMMAATTMPHPNSKAHHHKSHWKATSLQTILLNGMSVPQYNSRRFCLISGEHSAP